MDSEDEHFEPDTESEDEILARPSTASTSQVMKRQKKVRKEYDNESHNLFRQGVQETECTATIDLNLHVRLDAASSIDYPLIVYYL